MIAKDILDELDVVSKFHYDGCCGMPQLEGGDIDSVTKKAIHTSSQLEKYINEGYKILSLVPSCSLMLKYGWSLLMPENEKIKKLSMNTFDICEFLVEKLSNGIPKNFFQVF